MARTRRSRTGPVPGGRPAGLAPFCLALALTSTSCIPATFGPGTQTALLATAAAPRLVQPAVEPLADASTEATLFAGSEAAAANAAIPLSGEGLIPASSHVFRARTPLDGFRSLDCLAEAIWYEARSESEEGQKAVAQVVLNRVRHPAWPNSVCGVVYQGPMRPGGGCQFTFTCDGSLARRPSGAQWAAARRIAAAALAGATYAPVGLSTHYHTHEVLPAWAPRLAKTAVIGAHNFYRLPGSGGAPNAFRAAYAGSEPFPVPAVRRAPVATATAALPAWARPPASSPRAASAAPAAQPADDLPPSTIREEYRHSGQWRADAPAAITGRR